MIKIDSKAKWKNTGINLVAGRRYRYQVIGRWKDWYIECDANGYSNFLMNLVGCLKRVPSAKWFQLIGVVNKNTSHIIKLGTDGTFTAPVSGLLWVFANDAEFAYCNNSGSVELHIHEDA
ncbi:hypothetical protein [Methylobacter sp. YRD-M1]|uniref:hypothetical protein n=1 Tax=Methylobacter sp. YRD-M1 TaxID=2911520 RepID=UPI00227BD818|nr:hypothetical protein [Methylobacter sp. YRD-M1]WAK00756.1 hypothetical protein LZ558_12965 [Methylobacter sp. YRD-M1]